MGIPGNGASVCALEAERSPGPWEPGARTSEALEDSGALGHWGFILFILFIYFFDALKVKDVKTVSQAVDSEIPVGWAQVSRMAAARVWGIRGLSPASTLHGRVSQ